MQKVSSKIELISTKKNYVCAVLLVEQDTAKFVNSVYL
jgi:hypothetical protein